MGEYDENNALMLRTAVEQGSREAAEEAIINDVLRMSLLDQPSQSQDEDFGIQCAIEDAAATEKQNKARAIEESTSHNADTNKLYPHDALPGPEYIRVLTVLPSDVFHESLVCSIELVPLDKSSFYSAISYSWALNDSGDASRRQTIIIDGTAFQITQNLSDCLRRIRDRHRPRRLWVDAICINQADEVELGNQVARMAQIYQNADKVFVWLGEGATSWEDKLAFDALKWFSMQAGRIAHNSDSGWNDEDGDRILADLGLSRSSPSRTLWYPVIEALNKLWNRRYFTRRWIVQELAYAPSGSLRILWGPHRCSYADFLDGADQACSIALEMINGTESVASGGDTAVESLAEETIRLTQKVRDVVHFHDRPADGQRQDICYVLSHCNSLQCMNDRDILYALAKLDSSLQLVPDYTASTSEVYVRFARKLLDMLLFEQLLANATRSRNSRLSDLGLPSWVPDLRSPFIDVGLSTSPLTTSIEGEKILKCELYCLGIVSDSSPLQMRAGVITLLSLGSDLPQKAKIAPHQSHVAPGDLACCTGWVYGRHVVFLRPEGQYYKITYVMGQNLFTPIPFTGDPPMTKTTFQII